MTVYSIDKRTVPEANMTPASADKQQAAVSPQDAFVALLQKASYNFGNRTAGLATPDAALSAHFDRPVDVPKADPAPAPRKDDNARGPVSKDAKGPVKGPVTQKSASNSAVRAKDDQGNQTQASSGSDDDTKTVAATDDTSGGSTSKDDKSRSTQDDSQQQVQGPQVVAQAFQQQQVQVVQQAAIKTAGDGQNQAVNAGDANGGGHDPLAGQDKTQGANLNDQQAQGDANAGGDDDSGLFDAAMQAATAARGKSGPAKTNAGAQGKADAVPDTAQGQADDMAAMLAGTDANLAIKVKVNDSANDAPAVAAPVADALSQQDAAAQDALLAQGSGQNAQGQNGLTDNAGENALSATQQNAADVLQNAQATAAKAAEEAKPFAVMLAAQLEANNQPAEVKTPDAQPVAGLASVGATQATDKPAAAQATQQPHAPRTVLQQSVADQISVQIDKQVKEGSDTVKISLRPLDLGKIEIKLQVNQDGTVSATVTAEKPETLAMLQKDHKGLEKALEDAGLKPETDGMSFNLRGEQQQNANQGGNNPRAGRRRRALGLDNTGDVGSINAAGQAQRSLGGRSNVDISV